MKLDRKEIDLWFPIYLRYLGSLLAILLTAAIVWGKLGINVAAGIPLVIWMLGYKSIHDFGRDPKADGAAVAPARQMTITEAALAAAERLRRERIR